MLKIMSSIVLILAVSAAIPAATAQEAMKLKPASATKTCKAKIAGKVSTWKCLKDAPCCINESMGKGVCGTKELGLPLN